MVVLSACTAEGSGERAASTTDQSRSEGESAQLGVCSGHQQNDAVECHVVEAGGQELQFAVVTRPSVKGNASTRLFLPGGPGQDATKAASFDPNQFFGGSDRLIVLGEPSSSLQLSSGCRLEVQAFVDYLFDSALDSADQEFDVGRLCERELRSFAWSPELFDATAATLKQFDIDEVVASSFGARLLEGFVGSGSQLGVGQLDQVILAAPAPSAFGMDLDQVIANRTLNAEGVLCSNSAVCGLGRSGSQATYIPALLNAGYDWATNEAFFLEYESTSDDVEEIGIAARAFVFVDPAGDVDPQLVSHLAVQCSAYGVGERAVEPGSQIGQFMGSLYEPCAAVADVVGSMPSGVVAEITSRLCVGYSTSDPVVGKTEAESFENMENSVFVEIDVPAGHLPSDILSELEGLKC